MDKKPRKQQSDKAKAIRRNANAVAKIVDAFEALDEISKHVVRQHVNAPENPTVYVTAEPEPVQQEAAQ